MFVCGSRESSEKRGMFSTTSVDRQSATLPRHRRTTPTPPHTKNDTTQTTIHTAVHRLYQKRPRAGISSCTRRMTRSEKPLSAICICALSAKNPRRSSSSTLPLLLIKFLSSFIRLCSFSYYLSELAKVQLSIISILFEKHCKFLLASEQMRLHRAYSHARYLGYLIDGISINKLQRDAGALLIAQTP